MVLNVTIYSSTMDPIWVMMYHGMSWSFQWHNWKLNDGTSFAFISARVCTLDSTSAYSPPGSFNQRV